MLGELKTKSGKGLFKNLNEHSKKVQAKQETTIKKYNSLSSQYKELEHLKVNMNDYLGRNKTEKKGSVIDAIKKHRNEDMKKSTITKKVLKETER